MADERRLRRVATPSQRLAWVATLVMIAIAMLALRDRGMVGIGSSGSGIWIATALLAGLVFLAIMLVRRRHIRH